LTLLEFHGRHHAELAVLTDSKLLFLASFINELGSVTLSDLSTDLGWPLEEVEALWMKLSDAGFGSDVITVRGGRLPYEVQLSSRGKRLLNSLGVPQTLAITYGDAKKKALRPGKRVFVVHGRNRLAKEAMFEFLKALKLEPIEWNRAVAAVGPSPAIETVVRKGLHTADAVVVLLTGDDEVRLRGPLQSAFDPEEERNFRPQVRPNVLFEAGMALGKMPNRTVLVQLGDVKSFSDVLGRHVVRMDDTRDKLNELVLKLQSAGLEVDTTGDAWREQAGKFSEAIRFARTKDSLIAAYQEFLLKWEQFLIKRGLGLKGSSQELAYSTIREHMYAPDACIITLPADDGKDVINRIESRMELVDGKLLPVAIVVDSLQTNKLAGVVTPFDLPNKFDIYQISRRVIVSDIWTEKPFKLRRDQVFNEAVRYMDQKGVRTGLPVVDDEDRFVGFLPPHRGRELAGS
jgi:predicted nucleotide-binding protein